MGFLKYFFLSIVSLSLLLLAVGIYFYQQTGPYQTLRLDSFIEDDSSSQYPYAPAVEVKVHSEQQIVDLIRKTSGPILVSGVHYSLGGEVTYPDSLNLDMSEFDRILDLDVENQLITVQTGIRWQQIQAAIDPHDLALKVAPDGNDYSVGGSLSVDAHGRFIRNGALINSVRSIRIVLANGKVYQASPKQNAMLFYGAIGGFGGLGVITEATLELTKNIAIERRIERVEFNQYNDFFSREILDDPDVVLHQAVLYPPNFETLLDISWRRSDKPLTDTRRLQPNQPEAAWLTRLKVGASDYSLYHRLKKNLFDPLVMNRPEVVRLNLETSYNLRSLGLIENDRMTTVMQEYLIPLKRFEIFTFNMREIFTRYDVDIDRILIEYLPQDHMGLLAGAEPQAFSFRIIYYQDKTRESKQKTEEWTHELVRASRESNGIHILPFEMHDTTEQLLNAYAGAETFFALKRQTDPDCRFRNLFWDQHLDKIYGTKKPREAEK